MSTEKTTAAVAAVDNPISQKDSVDNSGAGADEGLNKDLANDFSKR